MITAIPGTLGGGMSLLNGCTPPDVNGAGRTVMSPPVPGPGACIQPLKLSNLDCHNKLVKRGVKVSYQGFRGIVVRVNRGRCVVGYLDAFERFTGWTEWVICERLQVVA